MDALFIITSGLDGSFPIDEYLIVMRKKLKRSVMLTSFCRKNQNRVSRNMKRKQRLDM